jgi:hypothetical protein
MEIEGFSSGKFLKKFSSKTPKNPTKKINQKSKSKKKE